MLTPASAHTPAYDVATLTTCDSEPIHVPGAIQPHGVLLATDPDLLVVVVSANLGEMLATQPAAAIGRPLADVVGPELAATVREARAEGFPHEPRLLELSEEQGYAGTLAGRRVDVRVHVTGERTVVEIEELADPEHRYGSRSARGAMARLAQGSTVARLADLLATEIRDVTGFDRVMVYRFDEEWNGEVIAETRREDLNPFLGLHYPATDIPAQARRLYRINPIRLIVDIDYVPVPLEPTFDSGTGEPLDLSHASLRSVSPIHVEYLGNMGVTASMSVSIIVDGELWGLVACHHYSGPHRPSQDARGAAELITQAAGALVAHRVRAEAREAVVSTQQSLAALSARITADPGDPLRAMVDDPALLDLVGATGVVLCFDGELSSHGEVPPYDVAVRIAAAVEQPGAYVSSTTHLAERVFGLEPWAHLAAGVLRIGSTPGRWLLWLRPEQPQVVDWGGDPRNKRLAASEDASVRLSPRKSFEKWREVTRGRSAPWEPWQLEAVDALGRHMNALLLVRAREQIVMAESVQRSVVLDRAPDFAGLGVVARYQPASSYQLGGDWWDAFEVGDRVALVVGDVAGHGVAAASAMTQLRTALRAYLFEGHGPAEALDRLDRLMDGLLDLGVATALVMLLDPLTGHAEVACAGHPRPLLLGADGGAELADLACRPLLGLGEGVASATTIKLGPGEGVLLYTDGLVECRGADLTARTEQLRRLAGDRGRRAGGEDDDALADRLLAELRSDEDDTTMLLLRRVVADSGSRAVPQPTEPTEARGARAARVDRALPGPTGQPGAKVPMPARVATSAPSGGRS